MPNSMPLEMRTASQPFFSIIVPTYNNADYLRKCIHSIQNQVFRDWEAIIVIDGSPDDAFLVASRMSDEDERIRIINKIRNEGTHLARKSGVELAQGKYSMFVDADDELAPNALFALSKLAHNQNFDVLHFGTELFGTDMPDPVCADILRLSNRTLPTLQGSDIVASSFSAQDEFRQDWRVLQRLYRTNLLKSAFKVMSSDRLVRGEDSYEWLVIASLASTELFYNNVIAYRYYLGRGITTFHPMSKDKFVSLCTNYGTLVQRASAYADQFTVFDLSPCVRGLRHRLIEMLFGDWYVRLSDKDKIETIDTATKSFTPLEVATELMRLSRDEAYSHWDAGDSFDPQARYAQWKEIAEKLADTNVTPQYTDYRNQAIRHFLDLKTRNSKSENKMSFFKKRLTFLKK